MNGWGIIRGLGVTLRHFFGTYAEDLRRGKSRYFTKQGVRERSASTVRGIFTVQYPEEKLIIPEEFRYLPFLVYDELESGEKKIRCTSCGICAKVCPPQCIWIERTTDPVTGRPVPAPVAFYIDIDICMNCGFCAEYCPFDAIKMDHDFEIASYDRKAEHIYALEKLLKPAVYYQSIRPENFAREEASRMEKEAKTSSKS
ncbi:MAG: 4Fe-4S binding protein [Anaerolineaceae bacterium]|nr:4Fe-4S binding protein [Anaerolineaceae bacterium]